MAETTYRVKNLFTGDRIDVPENLLGTYRAAVEPYTGKRLYEFLDDVPGYLRLEDGTIKPHAIPKNRVHESGAEGSQFLLPGPGLAKQSKQDERFRKLRKAAQDTPAATVATRAFLSGMSLGGSTALLDAMHNEDFEQIREMSMQEKKLAYFGGRAGSLLALGALPIPGLGRVAGAVFPSLKGVKNVNSIFALGGAAGSKVQGKVVGTGFIKEFKRRFGGSVAFGATTEIPLSLAMASADIVDHNKEYTADAISANFLSQYGFALALTIPGAALFSAVGAGVVSAGRPMMRAADDYLGAEMKALAGGTSQQELLDSGIRGLIRFTSRKGLRGRYFGVGDIIETQAYKVGRRLVKGQAGLKPSETRIGRWLAGTDADDFLRFDRNNKKAIIALSESRTAPQLREGIDVLLHNVRDPDLIHRLQRIRANADMLIPARRKAADLILDAERFADEALKAQIRPRRGMKPIAREKPLQQLRAAIDKVGLKGSSIRKNYMQALEDTLTLRRQVLAGEYRNTIDDAIRRSFVVKDKAGKTIPDGVDSFLAQLDGFDEAALRIRSAAARLKGAPTADRVGIRNAWEIIGSPDEQVGTAFRAQLRQLDGTYRGLTNPNLNAIADTNPFFAGKRPIYTKKGKELISNFDTRLNEMRSGLDALGQANLVQSKLLKDASPLFRAAKPVTQTERLAAQVETVIDTKRSIKAALMFAAVKGGGIRHTAFFGGVYAFRNLSTMAEKRDTFVAYRDVVMKYGSSPEAMQQYVGKLVEGVAAQDMGLGAALAANQMTGMAYLAQQLPQSADPMHGPEDFSSAEMENWLEALGALIQPISVLATASDGSVTAQSVDAFRAIYPELYLDAVIDVAEFVAEYGDKLDHDTLLGFDAFTGYALGYTDAPGPNFTFQPPYYQTTGQAQAAGAVGGPEHRRMDIMQNMTPAQKVGGL